MDGEESSENWTPQAGGHFSFFWRRTLITHNDFLLSLPTGVLWINSLSKLILPYLILEGANLFGLFWVIIDVFVAKLGKLKYVCVHFVLGGCDLSSGKIGNLPDFKCFGLASLQMCYSTLGYMYSGLLYI